MGLEWHLGFGEYDPENVVPPAFREPDAFADLAGWIHERTSDSGPVICGQAVCTECAHSGLHVAPLWRRSERHGLRPVWTLDGAACEACGTAGALRATLVGKNKI